MAAPQQKAASLPNPYAAGGLPNPYALASDDAAPAPAEELAKADDKKLSGAPRFHNPHMIKRPQAKINTPLKKPVAPKQAVVAVAPPEAVQAVPAAQTAPASAQKQDLNFFLSTADDDAAIVEANRELRREQAQKRKEDKKFRKMFGDWRPNDVYKLRYPTKVAAFQATGQYQDRLGDFRHFLRTARKAPTRRPVSRQSSDKPPAASREPSGSPARQQNPMFAPPPIVEPGPPPPPPPPSVPEPAVAESTQPEPSPPAASVPALPSAATPPKAVDVQAGKAAIAQALLLAKRIAAARPPAQSQPQSQPPPPPPPPAVSAPVPEDSPPPPPPPPPPEPYNPTISAPPVRYNPTISAAPVHYARPDPVPQDEGPPAKKQRTKEAPKQSKAALMMAKMGYVKGQGLGKNNDGVTTHLEVKIRKDQGASRQVRDELDDGDGKTVKSQQVFDIVGGRKKQGTVDHGPFGEPSRVVVTWGCVDGIDFATDADRDDGGIRQEMGDAFNEKFGPVERIHVNMAADPMPVYIQFKDPLCALNAVNRFHEGFKFQDRIIKAVFYDEPKFNNFVYDH